MDCVPQGWLLIYHSSSAIQRLVHLYWASRKQSVTGNVTSSSLLCVSLYSLVPKAKKKNKNDSPLLA